MIFEVDFRDKISFTGVDARPNGNFAAFEAVRFSG
jgi:hypothetical protein